MTDLGIQLEYEMHLASEGETLKTCPLCEYATHRPQCPRCANPDGSQVSLSGDSELDRLQARIEAGEEIENFEEILRGGFEKVELEEAGSE